MSLDLSAPERVARARADLRLGLPVALRDGEAEALVVAAEVATPERLAALAALGPLDLAVTARRAETLKAPPYDGDLARIALPEPAERDWLTAVIDPSKALARPLLGPFTMRRGGASGPHRLALALCKQARLLPAAVVAPVERAVAIAEERGFSALSAEAFAASGDAAWTLKPVASAPAPLEAGEDSRVHVFRPEDGSEEHYAVEVGRPPRGEPVLARLHSACFTGDLMGSLKCDCGPQLRAALTQIGAAGAGVLLYLNQEGRGIGLANKLRAYALQSEGFDTVEANHRLGFEDEERDFRIGAAMLRRMGFGAVRLMTNNPRKVGAMEATGLRVVERVPLLVGLNPHNRRYIATKRAKSGHLL